MQPRLSAACLILLLMIALPAGANSLEEMMGGVISESPLETSPDYDDSVLPPRPRLKMRKAPLSLANEQHDLTPTRYMRDDKKAYKRCLTEAKKGTAVAQYNLGVMYMKGLGVQKNDKEAVKWFRLAALNGDATAQDNLGVMYHRGQGVPKDYERAVHWCRLSAEQGFAPAQYHLGLAYFDGEGVPQSYEVAYAWWVVAAENSHQKALKNTKTMKENMPSSQIEKGQQRAKEIWARINK